MWGSEYILQLVIQKHLQNITAAINDVLNDLDITTPGSIKGLLLEPLALKLISMSTGEFE